MRAALKYALRVQRQSGCLCSTSLYELRRAGYPFLFSVALRVGGCNPHKNRSYFIPFYGYDPEAGTPLPAAYAVVILRRYARWYPYKDFFLKAFKFMSSVVLAKDGSSLSEYTEHLPRSWQVRKEALLPGYIRKKPSNCKFVCGLQRGAQAPALPLPAEGKKN